MSASPKAFYQTPAWLQARSIKMLNAGARCEQCGSQPKDGYRIEVHHIKERHSHPHLALVQSNLCVLCRACHMGMHWVAWGIKTGAANDPKYSLDPPKPGSFRQFALQFDQSPQAASSD